MINKIQTVGVLSLFILLPFGINSQVSYDSCSLDSILAAISKDQSCNKRIGLINLLDGDRMQLVVACRNGRNGLPIDEGVFSMESKEERQASRPCIFDYRTGRFAMKFSNQVTPAHLKCAYEFGKKGKLGRLQRWWKNIVG